MNTCADFFVQFYEVGDNGSYFTKNAEYVSDNRLYGICQISITQRFLKSMLDVNVAEQVVFYTVTLGISVNLAGLNHIHYGATSSIEDYCQECG